MEFNYVTTCRKHNPIKKYYVKNVIARGVNYNVYIVDKLLAE